MSRLRVQEVRAQVDVRNANQRWRERRACVVMLDVFGSVGLGEASPLPGYSPDTYDEACEALSRFEPERLTKDVRESVAFIDDTVSPGSARCAIQTAYLDAIGKQRALPMHRVIADAFGHEPARSIPVAALVCSLEDAEEAHDRGHRTFKIKIGPDAPLALPRLVRARFPSATLRFDANQSFASAAWEAIVESLAGLNPEFVEEPTREATSAPFAIARDESLVHRSLDQKIDGSVLVLKPMVLGLGTCLAWVEQARARDLTFTFTHTFDGPIGRASCAELALACGSRAVGLGHFESTWVDVAGAAFSGAQFLGAKFSGSSLRTHDVAGHGVEEREQWTT